MTNTSTLKIYFAPLQESTDTIYRNAFATHFGNVDKYFAPYIVRQNDGTVKNSHLRDIKQANNQGYNLVPQILAGNFADFIFLVRLLEENGYSEINWNLGCPYPMVTNKGLGSGLLPEPERINSILEEVLPKINSTISVKMRCGLHSPDEVVKVINVLNEFPLGEIILHPRIAKQLYQGVPDEQTFEQVLKQVKHPLIYNGDIGTQDDLNRLSNLFGDLPAWMVGRGILKNPFFPTLLKTGEVPEKKIRIEKLRRFHDEIFQNYSALLSGSSHQLMRMVKFWSYFCFVFPDPHKTFKRVKKAVNIAKYETAVNENFQILRFHEEDERRPNSRQV